jgi:hypothetical protein
MGIMYRVRLEDTADAFDSLDEDDAEKLGALVDEDDEWLDLDKSGREIGELTEVLGIQNPFADELDAEAVRTLANALKPIRWAEFQEYVEDADDDVRPYYESFRSLVLLAAKLGQGMTAEAD